MGTSNLAALVCGPLLHGIRGSLGEILAMSVTGGAQTPGPESELERTQERLSWVLEQIETQESAEVRLHLGQLREQIIEDIEV